MQERDSHLEGDGEDLLVVEDAGVEADMVLEDIQAALVQHLPPQRANKVVHQRLHRTSYQPSTPTRRLCWVSSACQLVCPFQEWARKGGEEEGGRRGGQGLSGAKKGAVVGGVPSAFHRLAEAKGWGEGGGGILHIP